MVRSTASQDKQ